MGIETLATRFLDILAGFFLGGGSSGFAEALEPWLVVVFDGEIESGGDEIDELVEEDGVLMD